MNDDQATERRPDAVVWIDERHAVVARVDPAGDISTTEIKRWQQLESRYLGQVVSAIGGNEHVMLVGPQPLRLALERRFVAVGHRPDRLMATQAAASPADNGIPVGLDSAAA